MLLRAKNNVNKKRKAKEKIYKNIQRSASVTYNSTFAEKIGHQYIFYKGVAKKKKPYIKVEYNDRREINDLLKKKLKA